MCLAVPGKVVRRENGEALAEMHGTTIRVSTVLVPEVKEGDWVLVHAGFAIQVLSETDVAATWAVLDDLRKAEEASP